MLFWSVLFSLSAGAEAGAVAGPGAEAEDITEFDRAALCPLHKVGQKAHGEGRFSEFRRKIVGFGNFLHERLSCAKRAKCKRQRTKGDSSEIRELLSNPDMNQGPLPSKRISEDRSGEGAKSGVFRTLPGSILKKARSVGTHGRYAYDQAGPGELSVAAESRVRAQKGVRFLEAAEFIEPTDVVAKAVAEAAAEVAAEALRDEGHQEVIDYRRVLAREMQDLLEEEGDNVFGGLFD